MTRSLNENIRRFEVKQIVVSALALIIVVGTSVIINSYQLNSVAHEAAKFVTRLMQLEDIREVPFVLGDTRRDGISKIIFASNIPSRRFTVPPPTYINKPNAFWHDLVTSKITLPADDQLETSYKDKITFEYNRFRLAPYAVLIWLLLVIVSIPQTQYMKRRLVEQFEREMKGVEAQAKADIAREVRHNLRSPLAALMRVPSLLPDSVAKERELLKSTINQIKALISQLGYDAKAESSQNNSKEIYDTLIQSVQETAAALPSEIQFIHEVEDAVVSAYVTHIPHELRALIGNIVINSVEAINGRGTIFFKARDFASHIEIVVQDSGRGIPADVIEHIFDEGFSHGKDKSTGHGHGLSHAKRWIEKWGGTIAAKSESGQMTTITIELPIEERASWYVPKIRLYDNQPVIVVDDQESVRRLWGIRLDEVGVTNASVLSSGAEFNGVAARFDGTNQHPAIFLDYDLGDDVNGLDLFSQMKFLGDKYLVTGHFDDLNLRRRCERDSIRLLPKSQLADIPIIVV